MPTRARYLVGVISDTHGLVRPEAIGALGGVTHILHAGDVGGPEVLAALEDVAPVTAVRGNNDVGGWAKALPETATVTIDGARIHVIHEISKLDPTTPANVDVIISGHSHRASSEWRDGVLYFNPGSAGPRRFTLPITVGHLRIGRNIEAEIVTLDIARTTKG